MVTTVTNNSPQAINTSLFSLQKEIDDLRRQINQINGKDTASEPAKGLVSSDVPDTSLDAINQLIPDTATPENQLADKDFVNSLIDDSITDSAHTWSSEKIENITLKKGGIGVPQVTYFSASPSSGSYELVRFYYRSAFRCVISGTCANYAEAKIIDVISSSASSPQSNTLGSNSIGSQGSFSFGGGDWAQSSMYWNKPTTEEHVYYTVVFIPYSEYVSLVI